MLTDSMRRLRALTTAERHPIRAELPAQGGDETTAMFRLYDPIDSWGGDWGVSAKEFAAALDDLPDTVNEIRLHINSPGGEVFEGIAILNALRSHAARVVAVVDGLAASAASFVAVGADETVMAPNSELMIHDAWGLCVGNAEDMQTMAATLDHLSDNIASIYADKAGDTAAEWRAAMARESWYSAEEAVAAGLADKVGKPDAAGSAQNRFDLSIFTYAGRSEAPAPTPVHATPDPVASAQTPDPDAAPATPPEAEPAAPEPDDEDEIAIRARLLAIDALVAAS
jgi:ATP-dependent Clp endopeptidase proteolytic subunit ClpP